MKTRRMKQKSVVELAELKAIAEKPLHVFTAYHDVTRRWNQIFCVRKIQGCFCNLEEAESQDVITGNSSS